MMNRFILKIPSEVVDSPILATTIFETGVMVNILRAKVDFDEGTIVIHILGDADDQRKVVDSLCAKGVYVTKLERNITKNSETCVNCGACIGLCPTDALYFNEDYILEVDNNRCIRCGACVKACPTKSLLIQEI